MSDNVVKLTTKTERTIAAIKAKVEAAHAASREPTGRERLARLRAMTAERKEREAIGNRILREIEAERRKPPRLSDRAQLILLLAGLAFGVWLLWDSPESGLPALGYARRIGVLSPC